MNTKQTDLPPLPEGAVYLGKNGSFLTLSPRTFAGWYVHLGALSWGPRCERLDGDADDTYYAAPAGSEIVRVNACAGRVVVEPPQPQAEKTFIVGCLGGGPNFKPYSSYELAEKEAERLSLLHPNSPFLIAEVRTEVTATLVVTKK